MRDETDRTIASLTDRKSHAPLTSSTKCSSRDGIQGKIFVGYRSLQHRHCQYALYLTIRHDHAMILRAEVRLNPLPLSRRTSVDVFPGVIASDEGDRLNRGMITNPVDRCS